MEIAQARFDRASRQSWRRAAAVSPAREGSDRPAVGHSFGERSLTKGIYDPARWTVPARIAGSLSGFLHLGAIAACGPDEPTVEGQHRFTVRGGAEVQRIGEVHALFHAGQRPGYQGRVLERNAR